MEDDRSLEEGPDEEPADPGDSPRYWPKWAEPSKEERVETRCPACSVSWWIHMNLCGFRMRCDCGAWIDVPRLAGERKPLEQISEGPVHAEETRDVVRTSRGRVSRTSKDRDPLWHDLGERTSVDLKAPLEPGALRHASVRVRQRWTDRSILEMAGMVCAFVIPSILLFLLTEGRERALYMPLASLVSGMLVLLVGLSSGRYTFSLLRPTHPAYFLESVILAFVMAACALGWGELMEKTTGADWDVYFNTLKKELGIVWMLFVIGVCPAVFEELAFRGLLQGRFSALLGRKLGVLVTGAAFALAHGITIGFFFHMVLGVYLCWLRIRSNSLYPCMLTHFLYNATIVLFF